MAATKGVGEQAQDSLILRRLETHRALIEAANNIVALNARVADLSLAVLQIVARDGNG